MEDPKTRRNASMGPERLFTVKRNGKTFHKLFFLNPERSTETDGLARELLKLDQVAEVYVTRGDGGFMAQARFYGNKRAEDAAAYVREHYGRGIGREYGRLVSYLDFER